MGSFEIFSLSPALLFTTEEGYPSTVKADEQISRRVSHDPFNKQGIHLRY
jgi:hypothetical protein